MANDEQGLKIKLRASDAYLLTNLTLLRAIMRAWLWLALAPPLAHALAALKTQKTASYEDTWQATWRSPKFWDAFAQSTPDLARPELARFRGLCTNLRERDNVGRLTRETNGQTIDEQYRFPGVSEGRHANGANLAGAPRMEWFDEGGLREAAAVGGELREADVERALEVLGRLEEELRLWSMVALR